MVIYTWIMFVMGVSLMLAYFYLGWKYKEPNSVLFAMACILPSAFFGAMLFLSAAEKDGLNNKICNCSKCICGEN